MQSCGFSLQSTNFCGTALFFFLEFLGATGYMYYSLILLPECFFMSSTLPLRFSVHYHFIS